MNFLRKIFNHDSYPFGVLLSIVSPVVFLYMIFYFVRFLSGLLHFRNYEIRELFLLGLAINLLWIRYYLVNVKLLKTGHSVIVVSFVEMIIFFVFKQSI
jgi:hypothetical protein